MKLVKYFTVVASGLASFFLACSTWGAEYPAPKQGDWIVRDFRFHTGEVLPELRYGTSHDFAPDQDLGQPEFNSWPTANADMCRLAETCHALNIRLIDDIVLGFARSGPYERIAFDDFHIAFDPAHAPPDPDAWTSRPGEPRNSWGSTLWRYVKTITTYDPMTGSNQTFAPARHFHYLALKRWLRDFHVDGWRIDSVETVANWDFIGKVTDYGREDFRELCTAQGMSQDEADARFLSIGEELNQPMDLIKQGRVTSMWNDKFRERLRAAVLGQNAGDDPDFETSYLQADSTKSPSKSFLDADYFCAAAPARQFAVRSL
jgi:1,4-alpha-glucan branching enzyme